MPQISIVVPLYNKRSFIARALDSILAQTFDDFEIIVIDDGSTDGSSEVVKKYNDQRIRMITQKNMGVSAARNHGIEAANSDLIAFLDADDEWCPEFLYNILILREKYQKAGIYATMYDRCESNNKILHPVFKDIFSENDGIIDNYFRSFRKGYPPVCSSAVAVPKKTFLECGKFLEGENLGEDNEMWFRIALKYPVAYSRYIGAIYHREHCNKSTSVKTERVREEPVIKTAKNALNSGQVPSNLTNEVLEYIFKIQIGYAIKNILYGNPKIARKVLWENQTKSYVKEKIALTLLSYLNYNVIKFILKARLIVSGQKELLNDDHYFQL